MENSHINALQDKHSRIESRLAAEANRPLPDDVTIHMLKKQKLALKDEIATIRAH